MRTIEFSINMQTPLLNTWQRTHWAQKRKITARFAVRIYLATNCNIEPIKKCTIEIERHCSGVLPDWDGLYGGVKPLLDCLVVKSKRNPNGLGLILDDSPKVIQRLDVKPVQCKRNEHKTVVRITEVET